MRKNKKQSPAYRKSAKREQQIAKKVGGRVTPGSGNKKEKGDVRNVGVLRLEHKLTGNKSFRVTRDMVEKINTAAIGCEELPILLIEFMDNESGNIVDSVAIVPWDELRMLINDG